MGLTYYPISITAEKDVWNVPKVTARKFDQLESQKPFMADRIWNSTGGGESTNSAADTSGMGNLSHNNGKLLAFNCAFKAGQVIYYKGKRTPMEQQDPTTKDYIGRFHDH